MVFSQLCLLFGGFRSWLQGRISEQYTRFSYSSVIRPWQLLKPPIPDKAESIWFERKNPWISRLVALFLLEGGSIWPPPVSFFLHNYLSKAVEIFWLFLNIHSPNILTAWVHRHTAWMTTFSCNKLNFVLTHVHLSDFDNFYLFGN